MNASLLKWGWRKVVRASLDFSCSSRCGLALSVGLHFAPSAALAYFAMWTWFASTLNEINSALVIEVSSRWWIHGVWMDSASHAYSCAFFGNRVGFLWQSRFQCCCSWQHSKGPSYAASEYPPLARAGAPSSTSALTGLLVAMSTILASIFSSLASIAHSSPAASGPESPYLWQYSTSNFKRCTSFPQHPRIRRVATNIEKFFNHF